MNIKKPSRISFFTQRVYCRVLLIIILGMVNISHAASTQDTRQNKSQQLQAITQQIQQLTSLLNQDKDKQKAFSKDLQEKELAIEKLTARQTQLNKELNQHSNQLSNLLKQQAKYQEQIQQQQTFMAQQIRAIYQLGRDPYLKVLFNHSDVNSVNRLVNYYRYIYNAQLKLIQQWSETLQQVQANQQAIQAQTNQLQQLRNQQHQQQLTLEANKRNREQLLAKLSTNIQTKDQKLKELQASKQALENLLKKLQEASFILPPGNSAFAKLRGKLSWPTKGKIAKHYGTSIAQSELRYNGVLIAAPLEQSVHAIYQGQVVFANWLQGFGLMVIIDHGKGFMTLYGQNHNLYKKVGDRVKPGDIIASVGNSTEAAQSGLYFEIRQNGRPINPENWCRSA